MRRPAIHVVLIRRGSFIHSGHQLRRRHAVLALRSFDDKKKRQFWVRSKIGPKGASQSEIGPEWSSQSEIGPDGSEIRPLCQKGPANQKLGQKGPANQKLGQKGPANQKLDQTGQKFGHCVRKGQPIRNRARRVQPIRNWVKNVQRPFSTRKQSNWTTCCQPIRFWAKKYVMTLSSNWPKMTRVYIGANQIGPVSRTNQDARFLKLIRLCN